MSDFSLMLIFGLSQLHSSRVSSVKLNLFIVNIAGTSLTFLNSFGSSTDVKSGIEISLSKKLRLEKVYEIFIKMQQF